MKSQIYIPNSLREAARQIRLALTVPVEQLSKRTYLRAWSAIAYLFPGLHPDCFEDAESGWPPVLRRFAAEAWRRAGAGELTDAELYASDAQWSGLCDRIESHTPDETRRRRELAALSLDCARA